VKRLLATVLALGWLLFPGFGLIDLSVLHHPLFAQHVWLEAGWGLYMTLFAGVPCLVLAVRPGHVGALAVLLVAAALLFASAGLGLEPQLLAYAALLISTWWALGGRAAPPRPDAVSWPLVALALLGIPWLWVANEMYRVNRASLLDRDLTNGVDHYAVQGALAVALVALPLLASRVQPARVLAGGGAGLAGGYLGYVALVHPETEAALAQPWAWAAIGWGACTAIASCAGPRRTLDRS
jgi:hypothetical protein